MPCPYPRWVTLQTAVEIENPVNSLAISAAWGLGYTCAREVQRHLCSLDAPLKTRFCLLVLLQSPSCPLQRWSIHRSWPTLPGGNTCGLLLSCAILALITHMFLTQTFKEGVLSHHGCGGILKDNGYVIRCAGAYNLTSFVCTFVTDINFDLIMWQESMQPENVQSSAQGTPCRAWGSSSRWRPVGRLGAKENSSNTARLDPARHTLIHAWPKKVRFPAIVDLEGYSSKALRLSASGHSLRSSVGLQKSTAFVMLGSPDTFPERGPEPVKNLSIC